MFQRAVKVVLRKLNALPNKINFPEDIDIDVAGITTNNLLN